MKLVKSILIVLLFTIIPPIAKEVSKENGILDQLSKAQILIHVDIIKQIILLIGITLPPIFLSIKWQYSNNRLEKIEGQRARIIEYLKDVFMLTLEKKDSSFKNCNIRIFVPKKSFLEFVKIGKHKSRRAFIIRNIPGISIPGTTNGLEFEVEPEPEGVLGECYKTRQLAFEHNMVKNGSKFKLSDFQKGKTNHLDFVLCHPIFDKNDEILAIVAIDSTDHIIIKKEQVQNLSQLVGNFSQSLYETVPDLFR